MKTVTVTDALLLFAVVAVTVTVPATVELVLKTSVARPSVSVNTTCPPLSSRPWTVLAVIWKTTGTLATGLPWSSKTWARSWVLVPVVMRGGFALSKRWSGRALPILTCTVADACVASTEDAPVTEPVEKATTGGPSEVVLGEGLGAVVAPPPENALTVAVPDRLSETRLTRTTPSLVLPCSSIFPRLVKNCTTVPSGTGSPVALSTRPEITETSPWAAMNSGLAMSVIVDPGGAFMIAWLHVPRSPRRGTRRRVAFFGLMRHLPSNERSRRDDHPHGRRHSQRLRARHGDDRQRIHGHRPRPLSQGAEGHGGDHARARRSGGPGELGPRAAGLQVTLDPHGGSVEREQRARGHVGGLEQRGVVAEHHLHPHEVLHVQQHHRDVGGLADPQARLGRAHRRGDATPLAGRHRRRARGLHHGP